MLTINRSCSYKIITRAVRMEQQPLVAMLEPAAEDCEPCFDPTLLQARLDANEGSIIVYNQHPDALKLVSTLRVSEAQVFIEIRQDTKGVLGLHAIRNRHNRPTTLELIYQ